MPSEWILTSVIYVSHKSDQLTIIHDHDLAKGKPAKAMEHHFSINLIATEQAKIVPKLTKKGFEKRKIPKDVYSAILTNRKKLLVSGEKWKLEYCSNGIQNCMKVYESEEAQECHTVSSERYFSAPIFSSDRSSRRHSYLNILSSIHDIYQIHIAFDPSCFIHFMHCSIIHSIIVHTIGAKTTSSCFCKI